MKDNFSKPVRLRVWGDYACFTRPETKVERVSYEVMTPSAARGMLEAIFWKPEMLWQVDRIHVLKPIRHDSIRRNEVNGTASKGSGGIDISDSKNRAQRAALILRDVAYVIEARLSLTEKAGPEDTLMKYVEMFERRAEAGQCFHRPCLGCREFAADFALLAPDEAISPISESFRLGRMLYDIDYAAKPPRPLFFAAELKNGVLNLPSRSAVLAGEAAA